MNALLRTNDDAEQRGIEALYQRGFRLLADGRYVEASAFFRAMLHASPSDERGWLALGDCHEKLGQLHVALELYSAGTIAAQPAPRCLLSRFRALYDMNLMLEAQHAYDQALQIAVVQEDDAFVAVLERERLTRS